MSGHGTAPTQEALARRQTLRATRIDPLSTKLEGHRAELAVASREAVQQESLESGDIEPF